VEPRQLLKEFGELIKEFERLDTMKRLWLDDNELLMNEFEDIVKTLKEIWLKFDEILALKGY